MTLNDLLEQNNRTAAAWAEMEKHVRVLQETLAITGGDPCDYCAHRSTYICCATLDHPDDVVYSESTVCPRCHDFSMWERE